MRYKRTRNNGGQSVASDTQRHRQHASSRGARPEIEVSRGGPVVACFLCVLLLPAAGCSQARFARCAWHST